MKNSLDYIGTISVSSIFGQRISLSFSVVCACETPNSVKQAVHGLGKSEIITMPSVAQGLSSGVEFSSRVVRSELKNCSVAGSTGHLWPKETLINLCVALQSLYTRSGNNCRQ